jgi:hypothetical protein
MFASLVIDAPWFSQFIRKRRSLNFDDLSHAGRPWTGALSCVLMRPQCPRPRSSRPGSARHADDQRACLAAFAQHRAAPFARRRPSSGQLGRCASRPRPRWLAYRRRRAAGRPGRLDRGAPHGPLGSAFSFEAKLLRIKGRRNGAGIPNRRVENLEAGRSDFSTDTFETIAQADIANWPRCSSDGELIKRRLHSQMKQPNPHMTCRSPYCDSLGVVSAGLQARPREVPYEPPDSRDVRRLFHPAESL